jgi:O-glycosyl hydrolase
VYASTDTTAPGRIVIVIVNRAEEETVSSLRIQDATTFTSGQLYQLTSAAPLPSAKGSITASDGNTFDLTLPGYSVSVLVPAP